MCYCVYKFEIIIDRIVKKKKNIKRTIFVRETDSRRSLVEHNNTSRVQLLLWFDGIAHAIRVH